MTSLSTDALKPTSAGIAAVRPPRIDGQITGLAGELFVAAELLKRGLQTSITFGNAKAVDLLAFNVATGRCFTVQVKALRKSNYFPISVRRVEPAHVYVFTLLNAPGQPVQYFIVPGAVLAGQPELFGKYFDDPKFPGISPKSLAAFENAWQLFDEPGLGSQVGLAA